MSLLSDLTVQPAPVGEVGLCHLPGDPGLADFEPELLKEAAVVNWAGHA